jgi:DNA polymerase
LKLYIDLESYNEWPIKSGVYRYAEHESCEIMLVSYALDDGPEQVWDLTVSPVMPADLRRALEDPAVGVVMHNSAFDRTVMRETGMFELPPSRIIDTMVQAYCHGLPGGLDKLCKLFNLPDDQAKMKEGRALVLFFCKPNAGKRNTRLTHPEKWAKFVEYAKRDITSMRRLHSMIPTWNYPGRNFPEAPSSEHRLWCIDQRINDRGFAVDLRLAAGAVETSRFEKAYLNQRTSDITSGDVKAATQRDKLLAHVLAEYGVTLPDTKADTLQRRIDDENLPLELRQLLDLRVQSSRNTATKYKTVLDAANDDGRVRGCIQFCGAPVTGRFSGKIVQPQNFMRPTMKQEAIDEAIRLIKLGSAELVYDNMPEVLGNCIRGVIVAPPGRMLFAADLKSIEGRGLAWLAGEDHVTKFYHDFDAGLIDYDSYMLAYAMCFGVNASAVTKTQRSIGKPIELAFGFGGSVGAFLTFAMTYHLDLDAIAESIWLLGDLHHLSECADKWTWAKANGYSAGLSQRKYAAFEYVKQKWRAARPRTVAFWDELANGFRMATLYPDTTFFAGPIKFYRQKQWLRMRLPSGRNLNFLQPSIENNQLSFMGSDRYSRKWTRLNTHGGKLSGLATQAFASDILRDCLVPIEDDGFDIVLTVHDEVVAEGDPSRSVDEMARHMITPKPYAKGLPLAVDGFSATSYRKN